MILLHLIFVFIDNVENYFLCAGSEKFMISKIKAFFVVDTGLQYQYPMAVMDLKRLVHFVPPHWLETQDMSDLYSKIMWIEYKHMDLKLLFNSLWFIDVCGQYQDI